MNHRNFDDVKWNYILSYSFFGELYAKTELVSLFELQLKSRLVSGTKASATCSHLSGPPAASADVWCFFARGNESSASWRHLSRARAAHTARCSSTRPTRHTSRFVPMLKTLYSVWKWGWGRGGGNSGMFCCPVCDCRMVVWLFYLLKVNCKLISSDVFLCVSYHNWIKNIQVNDFRSSTIILTTV